MSETITDEAVEAALGALDTGAAGYLVTRGHVDERDVRRVLAAAAPFLRKKWERDLGVPAVEYSIVRDRDGHRYGGYSSDCRAPGCDCYLATIPEVIVGDDHIEARKVYRTRWAAIARGAR